MEERILDIEAPGGKMETFITHPEDGGPFHAVIIYMDLWGVREELYDIARRVATVGYVGVVPDLYYRQGRVRAEFRDDDNRMLSLHNLDEDAQAAILAPMRKLSNALVMEDTGALIEFFKADDAVHPGAMGSIGYCMGGPYVLSAAGYFPQHFRASACLHGTRLITDREDSPHLLAGKFQGEVYCGFGEHDPYTPPSLIEQFAQTMRASDATYRFEVHAGAEHGYALPNRDIHDRVASARDWEIIFAMFHRQMPAYAGAG